MIFFVFTILGSIILFGAVAAGRAIFKKVKAKKKKSQNRYYKTESEIEAEKIEYEKWRSGITEEHKEVLQRYRETYDRIQQLFLRANYENKEDASIRNEDSDSVEEKQKNDLPVITDKTSVEKTGDDLEQSEREIIFQSSAECLDKNRIQDPVDLQTNI